MFGTFHIESRASVQVWETSLVFWFWHPFWKCCWLKCHFAISAMIHRSNCEMVQLLQTKGWKVILIFGICQIASGIRMQTWSKTNDLNVQRLLAETLNCLMIRLNSVPKFSQDSAQFEFPKLLHFLSKQSSIKCSMVKLLNMLWDFICSIWLTH